MNKRPIHFIIDLTPEGHNEDVVLRWHRDIEGDLVISTLVTVESADSDTGEVIAIRETWAPVTEDDELLPYALEAITILEAQFPGEVIVQ